MSNAHEAMISWPAAKIGCREGVDGIEMGTLKHLQFPTPEDPEELVVRQEREQLRRASHSFTGPNEQTRIHGRIS